MKRMRLAIGAAGLLAIGLWLGCQPVGTNPLEDILTGGAPPSDSNSVGDVTDGIAPGNSDGVGTYSEVRARVRNESSARADVTLRFIRGADVVHLAFVRVLPDSITTVTSPESVEAVELSGVDETGRALQNAVYVYGVDFDVSKPADYLVRDPDEPTHPTPEPEPVVQLRLSLLAPASAVTVTLGGTLTTRWTDEASTSGLLTLSLQPLGGTNAGQSVTVGPAIGVALDGINDELTFIVQNVEPGAYQLVGRLEDGTRVRTATAAGRIQVVRDPENVAPTIQFRGVAFPGILSEGESFTVAWDDDDPDDNATITIELAAPGNSEAAGHRIVLGPSIAENPDGSVADSASFVVRGSLPGLYDVVATIDDGTLRGSSRLDRAIRILPPRENDPSQLTLLQPDADIDLEPGRSFLVRWADADTNDDARISLLLDPDLGNGPLDGDEILLAAALSENSDGVGDQLLLGVATDTPLGNYRVVGVITDGLTESLTRAPGILRLKAAAASGGNTNDNTNTNANDNSNTNDNGNDNTPDNGNGNGNTNGNDNSGSGGGVIIIPLPDGAEPVVSPLDTPQADQIVVVDGEPVQYVVDAEVVHQPARASSRIFLSNLTYGGAVRLDVTPDGFPPEAVDPADIPVELRTDLIPNVAWPRKFNIEVETVSNGLLTLNTSPTPIWILQRVEIVAATLSETTCLSSTNIASDKPLTLQIQWFGGGVDEVPPFAQLNFWLTTDGEVPSDGVIDAGHRLLAQVPGSPNRLQTTTVNLAEILANDDVIFAFDGITRVAGVNSPMSSGGFVLVASYGPREGGGVASSTFQAPITICAPEPTPVETGAP